MNAAATVMRREPQPALISSLRPDGPRPAVAPDVLVVGGKSRVAAALLDRIGAQGACVTRTDAGRPCECHVDDYGDIPCDRFEGISTVVNCVGAAQGAPALLGRVNVDIPLMVAKRARDAGVRRLIHISSFAVYGGARRIDRHTATAPTNNYGVSRLMSDERLLALATPEFQVTVLRLPLIYGRGSYGKLGKLLSLWRRLGVMPVPSADVRRAMVGVDLAAEVLERLLAEPPQTGILHAADPQPFTYLGTSLARPERLRRLSIPSALTSLAEHVWPALGARLFANSDLADADNVALQFGLETRLYRDIAEAVV